MKKPLLIGVLLLLCHADLYAVDNLPPPFTAEYNVYAKGFPLGRGTRTLTPLQGGKFVFETSAQTTGLIALFTNIRIEERSVFTQIDGKIRPLEYTYRQTGKKSRLNHILFDWSQKVAKNTFKNQTKVIPLKEETLDRLLYQMVLMIELEQNKSQIRYFVADKGKIKVYIPMFLGKEVINTGIGRLKTVKYERRSSNGHRRTTLWCAPTLHYLPARVEHIEDGDRFSMVLESVQGL